MRQEKKTGLKGARIMNFRAKAQTWYIVWMLVLLSM